MMKNLDLRLKNKWFDPYYIFIVVLISIGFSNFSCADDDPDFVADFGVTILDDNHILFTNLSEGEYYSLVWDFGNGQKDTTTNKSEEYTIYYPFAGDYTVSLQLMNYRGDKVSTSKDVNISVSDLVLSFTALVEEANPNVVNVQNTSIGSFDSFEFTCNDETYQEENFSIYLPFAGNYTIVLNAYADNALYTADTIISILEDDPNYEENMELVFFEDFNYTGSPDPTYWNMETGGNGWGNNELQYYTTNQSNVYVNDGVLTITAIEEQYGGRDYTSARITTQNKFEFQYGKIEARIKLPYGQGMWPAFWMLGENFNTAGWPECGEIDIMEMVGGTNGDNTCHSTLHWSHDGSHASYGDSYTLSSGILADDYHVFTTEWDEYEIRSYIDGIHFYTADITPAQLSEFHNDFFIILNLAVGGTWPGSPDGTTVFPQTMKVDYVKVYQMVGSSKK